MNLDDIQIASCHQKMLLTEGLADTYQKRRENIRRLKAGLERMNPSEEAAFLSKGNTTSTDPTKACWLLDTIVYYNQAAKDQNNELGVLGISTKLIPSAFEDFKDSAAGRIIWRHTHREIEDWADTCGLHWMNSEKVSHGVETVLAGVDSSENIVSTPIYKYTTRLKMEDNGTGELCIYVQANWVVPYRIKQRTLQHSGLIDSKPLIAAFTSYIKEQD